jgi:hypothetical protein
MTDLPPNTVPGQGYGEQAEQRRQMQALPMGAQPGLEPPPSLTAPTARPNEPVQAGLPIGPGPGPEALGAMSGEKLTIDTLRALRRRFPSPTLDEMIKRMMDGL